MTRRPIQLSSRTEERQRRAADPAGSAWVSAHAGSGKTHVLARRVIRLLLDGAEPSTILCLTYTRAAAGEMKGRIFRELGAWAVAGDAELAAAIAGIDGRMPDAARLAVARRLFARALETPGGLKIQTIHAFCEAVLKRFPLEANIAGHFTMIGAAEEAALLAEARRDLLAGIDDPERPGLAAAFARVLARGRESGLEALFAAIIGERDGLRAFIDGGGRTMLHDQFDISRECSERSLTQALWPDPWFDLDRARALHDAVDGKGRVKEFAEKLIALIAEPDPVRRAELSVDLFFTREGVTRVVATKVTEARMPDFAAQLARKAAEVGAVAEQLATLRLVEDSAAMLELADALLARYERKKAARGLLDFNDLIHRTLTLLSRADSAQWVQYKLDRGIAHLLVDEAQDTSPAQWQIIASLVSEFFAGAGAGAGAAAGPPRTLFAVGDEKQSIYSFQGAAPAAFGEERERHRRAAEGAGQRFESVRLTQSFRSTADVLAFVDEVFADPATRAGLTRDPEPIEHATVRAGAPGSVELWPSLGASSVEEPEDWRQAIDHAAAPAVRLAGAIARQIGRWLASGTMIEGKAGIARPMTPRDVIVLVRKRDRFMHALSRALKEHDPQIPAAGVDRLKLSAHIAVKDMIALGRVCLQGGDDLALAALLKSPVFGLDDEALLRLATDRPDATPLGVALRQREGDDPRLATAALVLARWRDEAARVPPFEFYASVLGRDGVRRAMQARLGPEAAEILDEFLAFLLAIEREGVTTLEAVLSRLETAAPEIKREAAGGRDEVRVMTVHAAKGLEAPVVFLVDSGGAPASTRHLPVLLRHRSKQGLRPETFYVWRHGAAGRNQWRQEVEAALTAAAEEEYRRLLYVGLTRAEDRLIVCGYHGMTDEPQRWHAIAQRAIERLSDRVEIIAHPDLGLPIRRYRLADQQAAAPSAPPPPPPEPARPVEAPAWLSHRLPPEPALPRPLAPSGAVFLAAAESGDAAPSASPVLAGDDPGFAARRGQAIHRLLQLLPDLPAAERAEAASRLLDRLAGDWPATERARAADAVLAILADPAFAPVFAPGSRAEVPVQGTLHLGGRDRIIAGQIDRLAIAERVLLVDFKTGARPPDTIDGVAEAHLVQLALYRDLVAAIFPDRAVAAALLYVEAPRLVEIPDALLDAARGRVDLALART